MKKLEVVCRFQEVWLRSPRRPHHKWCCCGVSAVFLGVHLADEPFFSANTIAVIKKHKSHPLGRFRKVGLPTLRLTAFYRGVTENILMLSFTSWFSSWMSREKRQPNKIVGLPVG